jgi:hypothetical protein
MPRTALQQPHHRQPTAAGQTVVPQCIHRVLTTRRSESTRRRAQWRDHVPVQLDREDHAAGSPGPESTPAHRDVADPERTRRNAVRSSWSSLLETASRLLGSARITTRSPASSSSTRPSETCRNRRATRCRSTALPTDFATTRPILGASSSTDRSACTTRSGWTARTPRLTVNPKSVDRVIRYRAGSTALDPASNHAVRERRPLLRRLDTMARPARVRIRSRKPCTRARRRLLG